MHSLLATLAESRILLLTLFLSGAVHLAIFGGGWLDSEQPATLAAQNLTITVTAARAKASSENAEVETVLSDTSANKREKQVEAVPPSPVTGQQTESINRAGTESLVQQSKSEPRTQSMQELSAQKKHVKPDAVKPPGATERTPEQPIQKQVRPETVAVDDSPANPLAKPVYQDKPAFLKPPKPPEYPRIARKRGIEGLVMLRVELSETGEIVALLIEQSSGSGLLDSAASKAVQRWQFAPAKMNGFAVASYVRIPVNFVLE